jgi:hypothetical protein
MTAFPLSTALGNIESYLTAKALFPGGVQIGDYNSPPSGPGTAAAVFLADLETQVISSDSQMQTFVVRIRIYQSATAEPQDDNEIALGVTALALHDAMIGHFDVTAAIADMEIGGQMGTQIATHFDQITFGDAIFRIADIDVPLVYHG